MSTHLLLPGGRGFLRVSWQRGSEAAVDCIAVADGRVLGAGLADLADEGAHARARLVERIARGSGLRAAEVSLSLSELRRRLEAGELVVDTLPPVESARRACRELGRPEPPRPPPPPPRMPESVAVAPRKLPRPVRPRGYVRQRMADWSRRRAAGEPLPRQRERRRERALIALELLGDGKPARIVEPMWAHAGITESARNRLKKWLGVRSVKRGYPGVHQEWWWEPPEWTKWAQMPLTGERVEFLVSLQREEEGLWPPFLDDEPSAPRRDRRR